MTCSDTTLSCSQGSQLLAVPNGSCCVVLQMPRGNLEGVYPRALVVAAILKALTLGKYSKAWRLATANRVDVNILVDYRWPAFLSQAPAFVQQVTNLKSFLCNCAVYSCGFELLHVCSTPTALSHLKQLPLASEVKSPMLQGFT